MTDVRTVIMNNPDVRDLLSQFNSEKNREKIIDWLMNRTVVESTRNQIDGSTKYRISIRSTTRIHTFDIEEQLLRYADAMSASSVIPRLDTSDMEDYFEWVSRFEQQRDAAASSRSQEIRVFGRSLADWGW